MSADYPLTRHQLQRMRELVAQANAIALSIKQSGPVGVRHEAANLCASINEVDDRVRDIATAIELL